MQCYVDVEIRRVGRPRICPLELLHAFADATPYWQASDWQSTTDTGDAGIACMLRSEGHPSIPGAVLTFAPTSDDGRGPVSLVALAEDAKSYLTPTEWNAVAKAFAEEFASFLKTHTGARIVVSSETRGLRDIIRDNTVRDFFEQYLHAFPKSFHPYDLQRLDVFTCALHHSRHRQAVDVQAIKQYLIEDLSWSEQEAERVRERIDIGLDVLRVNDTAYASEWRRRHDERVIAQYQYERNT